MYNDIEEYEIRDLLMAAKTQFIDVAISDRAGEWSQQYYSVSDVKSVNRGDGGITVAVLTSVQDSRFLTVDTQSISGIKFNKYLNLNGSLTEQVRVQPNEE
jgi:hypothetical protein